MGLEAGRAVARFVRVVAGGLFGVRRGKLMVLFGVSVIALVLFLAVFAPVIAPYDPTAMVGRPLSPPCPEHPMGTNRLGQDMFSRIVYGARIAVMVVFLAATLSLVIGVPLGLVSGYYGGVLDRVLSLVMDAIYAFPSLILAIALAVALGPNPVNAAIAIAVVYVPTFYRMVRGETLKVKSMEFVEVARAAGLPTHWILARHILPHLAPTILVVYSLAATDAVLTEAALSFLGLAVPPGTPDWGYDLYQGKAFILSGYWWLVFFPGLMITLFAAGFALLSEGLSEMYRRE